MWVNDVLNARGPILVHGNVDDLQFDEIKYGEEMLQDYLARHAAEKFNRVYYFDLVTPLTRISDNLDAQPDSPNAREEKNDERSKKTARNIDKKNKPGNSEYDIIKTLNQVQEIMESSGLKNLVIGGFIEKLLVDEIITEQDRVVITIVLKWLQNSKILRSENLAVLICQNWNKLNPELKCSGIRKVEVPLPDAKTYEAYLRYLIYYFREIEE